MTKPKPITYGIVTRTKMPKELRTADEIVADQVMSEAKRDLSVRLNGNTLSAGQKLRFMEQIITYCFSVRGDLRKQVEEEQWRVSADGESGSPRPIRQQSVPGPAQAGANPEKTKDNRITDYRLGVNPDGELRVRHQSKPRLTYTLDAFQHLVRTGLIKSDVLLTDGFEEGVSDGISHTAGI
jgi:hypothetical protein